MRWILVIVGLAAGGGVARADLPLLWDDTPYMHAFKLWMNCLYAAADKLADASTERAELIAKAAMKSCLGQEMNFDTITPFTVKGMDEQIQRNKRTEEEITTRVILHRAHMDEGK